MGHGRAVLPCRIGHGLYFWPILHVYVYIHRMPLYQCVGIKSGILKFEKVSRSNSKSCTLMLSVDGESCKQEFALLNRYHKSVPKHASFFPRNCAFNVFIAPLPHWNNIRTFEGKTLATALVKWFPILKK